MKKLSCVLVLLCLFVILSMCTNPSVKLQIYSNCNNLSFISNLDIYKDNSPIESTQYIGHFNFDNKTAHIILNRRFYLNNHKLVGNWFSAEIYVVNNNLKKLIITPPHSQYNLTDNISEKIFNIKKNEFYSFIWERNPYNLTIFAIENGKLTKVGNNTYKIEIPSNISRILVENGFGMKKTKSKADKVEGILYTYKNSIKMVEFTSKYQNITYKFKLEVIR
ncbi:hypothetical protein Metvu_0882 [Methanocaldococcus vulcanius M7]|uniref:Uncharacterized protein n=1 Tax=Methanocaldococcus vulcanius (strain ATCC 700851 / DSM 12094 / M7) TaxID=579137 RepID=C9RGN8_METVM|nr:hypothetical protein [Methanocaldococcus vulcanius]ACX72740.1 hypothetical protein Metvu_0882 [Methanocaldococcus vulcanius M7]